MPYDRNHEVTAPSWAKSASNYEIADGDLLFEIDPLAYDAGESGTIIVCHEGFTIKGLVSTADDGTQTFFDHHKLFEIMGRDWFYRVQDSCAEEARQLEYDARLEARMGCE